MTLNELLSNSQAFQLFLDQSQEQFDAPIWSKFMTDQYVSSLEWKALGGAVREVAAGTIKDFSAEKPIRTRPKLNIATGEIPSMGDQWQMTPRQLRAMLDIAQTASIVKGNETQMLLDFLFPEVKKAALAPQKRLDWLLLQSLSTGAVVLDTTSNPDGVVWNISWAIETAHVTVTGWSVGGTTSVPLTDLRNIVNSRRAKGIPTQYIGMNWNTWAKMISSTQLVGNLGIRIPAAGGKMLVATAINNITVDMVNTYFSSLGLPEIMIIDVPIRFEGSKGTSTAVAGFADDRIVFLPSLNVGEVQWTYANEQRVPDKKKMYGNVNNVMIAQYMEKANFYTEYEFNAFPVLGSANEITILHTDSTS